MRALMLCVAAIAGVACGDVAESKAPLLPQAVQGHWTVTEERAVLSGVVTGFELTPRDAALDARVFLSGRVLEGTARIRDQELTIETRPPGLRIVGRLVSDSVIDAAISLPNAPADSVIRRQFLRMK